MENENKKSEKQAALPKEVKAVAPAKKKLSLMKHLNVESAKLLNQLRDKANQKEFGRKIKDAEILEVALKLVKPEHLKPLQEASLTEEERFEQLLKAHQKQHGTISREAFLGKLLRGEIKAHSDAAVSS